MLVLEEKPNSIEAESYRILRTNIQHSSMSSNLKSILITSADLEEGKSIVASNIALSFSQNGQSVIIVDCNLRKPAINKIFDIQNVCGLVEVLSDKNDIKYTIKQYNKNLYILPAGNIKENPSEMLDSYKMNTLIEYLKNKFDIVIIDSPPLQDVTDAQILATKVDGTILVVKCGESKKEDVLEAKELLDKVRANIIGAVLNEIDEEQKEEERKEEKPKRRKLIFKKKSTVS